MLCTSSIFPGDLECVKLLLAHDADVNKANERTQQSPILVAATLGTLECWSAFAHIGSIPPLNAVQEKQTKRVECVCVE